MLENGKRFVTLTELDHKLDKLPTRWEVRFLILVAFVGSQLIPAGEVARAAVGIFK